MEGVASASEAYHQACSTIAAAAEQHRASVLAAAAAAVESAEGAALAQSLECRAVRQALDMPIELLESQLLEAREWAPAVSDVRIVSQASDESPTKYSPSRPPPRAMSCAPPSLRGAGAPAALQAWHAAGAPKGTLACALSFSSAAPPTPAGPGGPGGGAALGASCDASGMQVPMRRARIPAACVPAPAELSTAAGGREGAAERGPAEAEAEAKAAIATMNAAAASAVPETGLSWEAERSELLTRLEGAQVAAERMQAAATLWKSEHAKLEAAAQANADGVVEGVKVATAQVISLRVQMDELERELQAEKDRTQAARRNAEEARKAAAAALAEAAASGAAHEVGSQAVGAVANARIRELERELAVASELLRDARKQLDEFGYEAGRAISQVTHEQEILRMGWGELEGREAASDVKAAHLSDIRSEVDTEKRRLSHLAEERSAVAKGEEALRKAHAALEFERKERAAADAAREAEVAAREASAAEREAAAVVAMKEAREAQAHALEAARSAEERTVETVTRVKRESTIEADEMHRELLAEAVSVASLSDELALAERNHEILFAASARSQVEAISELESGCNVAVRRAEANAEAALAEHAGLRTAAEEAHALCEAFDTQLAQAGAELTEREVYVCILLAELRADDLQLAASATAAKAANAAMHAQSASHSRARPSGLPAPTPASQLPHRAGQHLGLAARSRRQSPEGRGGGRVDEPSEDVAAGPTPPGAPVDAPLATPARSSEAGFAEAVSANEVAWEHMRMEHELKAALDAAAAAQRSAAAAERMASQQQAQFALTLRRERERMRAEHQADVAKVWKQVADMDTGA